MKEIKAFLTLPLLFLVAFDPQVPFLYDGMGFSLLVFFALIPFSIFSLFHKRGNHHLIEETVPFLVIFFVALVWIIFRLVINQGDNVSFVLSWFKAFFLFGACFLVFFIFYYNKESSFFLRSILCVYTVNGVINFIAGTYPEFFNFLDMFRGDVSGRSLGVNPYRNSFVSGSGYYSVGTAYGLIVLALAFYMVQTRSRSIWFAVFFAFSSVVGFVAARTAFFAIAPALFYIMRARVLYFFLVPLAGALLIYLLMTLSVLQPYKDWMISFFYFSDELSGAHLINQMYFWPGEVILLFGKGAVNDGTFVYTDSGYMQDILFGGIFFLLIKLSFIAYFVFCFFRKYPLFVLLVATSILVFHFKGLFLYNNAQGMAAFYFLFYYLLSYNRDLNLRRDNL